MEDGFNRVTSLFKRRALAWITMRIPRNQRRYMPVGIEHACRNASLGGDCLEYRGSGEEIRARIPEPLFRLTPHEDRTDRFEESTSTVVNRIENSAWKVSKGRIYTHRSGHYYVLSHANRIIAGASYDHDMVEAGMPPKDMTLSARFFPEPKRFSGVAAGLILGDGASSDLLHWLLDALPRLQLIERIRPLEEIDHFLIQGDRREFQIRSMELLGIPEHKLRFFPDQLVHVEADELLVGAHPRGWSSNFSARWTVDLYRRRLLPKIKPLARQWPKKIYVVEREAERGNRRAKLLDVETLDARGYQKVIIDEHNLDELAAFFSHADDVMVHDISELPLLMFCRPGTRIFELFEHGAVRYTNAALSDQADLCYDYAILGAGGNKIGNHEGSTAQNPLEFLGVRR